MDLRYLRYFIAVAEERSFTAAAERLNTAQPSISQQIKKLEDVYVGTPLFRRDKHHVELTEAGRVFLAEARTILSSVDRAIALARHAAKAQIGHLAIGFVPGAEGKVFPHILPRLRMRCPGIQLTLRSLTTPEQFDALRKRDIDVAFLRPPVGDRALSYEVVLQDEIVAAVPAVHRIASCERVSVAQLAELPLVQVSRSAAPAIHDLAERTAAEAGVIFGEVIETDSVLGTLNAVGAGLGFCFTPDYVRQICPATVAIRSLDIDPLLQIDLLVAFRTGDDTPALQVFLDLLRTWIAERQPVALPAE